MDNIDIRDKLIGIDEMLFISADSTDKAHTQKILEHRRWLKNVRHEQPSVNRKYRVGVYIRYFNQTKYEDYLDYHKKQYLDTLALCPNWELVGFYIDDGSSPPNMETAEQWSKLLNDAVEGKVDLIITQKVSNVSKNTNEVAFCARLLSSLPQPVGIYFVSEDIFTLSTYYSEDFIRDMRFIPEDERAQVLAERQKMLPE